jgi:hypothetical protein
MTPTRVKELLKTRIPYAEYRSEQLRREAEFFLGGEIPDRSNYETEFEAMLGIFYDRSYAFTNNLAACRELNVHFKVIDITTDDWISRIQESGCNAFLATPDNLLNIWRKLYEERLWVAAKHLHLHICPTFEELYIWESKRRMHDWLVVNEVPHPRTWVFTDQSEAKKFCQGASYPLVCKTDGGAASSGVYILRDSRTAEAMVENAFEKGILARSTDARDREWGSILLQEYIPHDHEWRIVRIGDDYLCRLKIKSGDFASGSGLLFYAAPTAELLNFARRVTDLGGFTSMSLDVFVRPTDAEWNMRSHFMVNELQAIIGAKDIPLNEHAGRWKYDKARMSWCFQAGDFYRNACANLRVMKVLGDIGTNTRKDILKGKLR